MKKPKNIAIYLMTIPAVVLFATFHTFPAIQGIFYSFTNWDGLSFDYDFVGLKNYHYLFQDENVLNSYLFTFKFAFFSTILVNVLSLLIAMGLNANIKFKNFFKAVYFLPNILSVLIVGYIFNYLFANVIPLLGEKLGIDFLSTNILGKEKWAWIGIVIVAVWQACAFNTILYLAGLQTVPAELYEAASIDGANKWQSFWHITFPMIAPFFTINMVLAMKNFLMVFDHVVALTGGGPGRSTESISLLIYNGGFQGGEFAYQSANAVIYFIVIMVVSLLQIKFLQKREVDM
ncbi:sugar ABC transporter permease [Anoxybacillus ayderensis]|uniref:carbohydrate ABC transporter permease n=1 Tax=unclassified Anoxybacillus TaxID=2639704 RepID=UPI0004750073|nr:MULTISPECIES: sugar ABC transporter permease [unclassified Anoxybacillus]AXM90585.1 sugar ABC transporter permease [Anoxybacillus ayderensis G10]MBW9217662.1 sugar ABC transporter permease [Anoxybacillus sp. ST70]NNU95761.1 sugar ABC transporter permease [Anoxybacillus sp. EFIL]THD16807.1 sugar ABC transporter permease [Anoxybacillus ayderensis]